MSTKWRWVEVRTIVDVGSEGGLGSHWMKARVEMEGGIVDGVIELWGGVGLLSLSLESREVLMLQDVVSIENE